MKSRYTLDTLVVDGEKAVEKTMQAIRNSDNRRMLIYLLECHIPKSEHSAVYLGMAAPGDERSLQAFRKHARTIRMNEK